MSIVINRNKKNNFFKILLLATLVSLLFSSCVAKKKVVEYKEKIVTDTISVIKERIVTRAIVDTLIVDSPCDTLGNLKPFEKEIRTEKARVKLTNVNGKIQVDLNIDSLLEEKTMEMQKSTKYIKDFKTKEVVKYRYPFWLILCLVISILLNILFLKSKLSF